jgi:hypothetical protein
VRDYTTEFGLGILKYKHHTVVCADDRNNSQIQASRVNTLWSDTLIEHFRLLAATQSVVPATICDVKNRINLPVIRRVS